MTTLRLPLAILALLSVFAAGVYVANKHCLAQANKLQLAAQAAQAATEEKYRQAADALSLLQNEQHKTEVATVREVERIITRPVYRNVCLDADGVRVANTAIGGAAASSASAVPGP